MDKAFRSSQKDQSRLNRQKILNFYIHQKAVVRTENRDSEPGEIGRGVRQACYIPILFSIYAEIILIDAMKIFEEGVRVGGELLKDVK